MEPVSEILGIFRRHAHNVTPLGRKVLMVAWAWELKIVSQTRESCLNSPLLGEELPVMLSPDDSQAMGTALDHQPLPLQSLDPQ